MADIRRLGPSVLTVGAGPGEPHPEVREALLRPIPLDSDPAFLADYGRTNDKLTRALRTSTPATILQSEAILGIEAAASPAAQWRRSVGRRRRRRYGDREET